MSEHTMARGSLPGMAQLIAAMSQPPEIHTDTITIVMPNGFTYLRSDEGIWAMQCGPKGLEIITDPENVIDDFEQCLSSPGSIIWGNERSLMSALVEELKLSTKLYKDIRDLRKSLNETQQDNRELYAHNRDFK